MHHLFRCTPCLLMMLLYWRTTMRYNYYDCWTCVREELNLPVTIRLRFCFHYLYHASPIILESERIYFGASSLLRLTIIHNIKDVLDFSGWVFLLHPFWQDLFQSIFLYCNQSHFASQLCSRIFAVSLLTACGRLSLFLHSIVDIMLIFIWVDSKLYAGIYWTWIWRFLTHKKNVFWLVIYAVVFFLWYVYDCVVNCFVTLCFKYIYIYLFI